MSALFSLGRTVATPGAIALGVDFRPLLARHQSGDWGSVPTEDGVANANSVHDGTRILSAYPTPKGTVWVITEADRSSTCVLLPEEY
jgi:hypothetical protein